MTICVYVDALPMLLDESQTLVLLLLLLLLLFVIVVMVVVVVIVIVVIVVVVVIVGYDTLGNKNAFCWQKQQTNTDVAGLLPCGCRLCLVLVHARYA